MAVKKTTAVVEKKVPIAEIRAENVKLKAENNDLKERCRCQRCNRLLDKSKFYVNTDPMCGTGVTIWCKDCCKDVAMRKDRNGEYHSSTIETVKTVLQYIDKPFIDSVWNASIAEANNLAAGHVKSDTWTAYIKNIQMSNYVGMRWKDSDMFKVRVKYDDEKSEQELVEEHSGQDTYDSYVKNKEDVIRLLDYDPFEKEPLGDQPFLYSQLLGMLDASEDANDDMMRVSSAIQIVRGFLQLQKIDDTVAKLMGNVNELQDNSATIKSLQDSKQKITSMITTLAAESCLSLKNSKRQVKGENTWTGKIKRLKDLNLRESEMNGFNLNTCRGMAQVQEISDASIMKQLALDESEWSDIVADMRKANQQLRKEKESYKEINRILLRENLDLKDYLEEKGLSKKENYTDLKDLYSVFSSNIEFTGEEVVDDESDNPPV